MTDQIFQHPQLGLLDIHVNSRARRIIFRAADEGLKVTIPRATTKKDLQKAIDEMLPKLQSLIERKKAASPSSSLSPDSYIDTEDFKLHFEQADVVHPTARFNKGTLTVCYPDVSVFEQKAFVDWVVKCTEESLRFLAKRILTARLQELATKAGLTFQNVSIKKTHGRWGSCSSKKNINLSLYLLLLPRHLQDYVMLHELCHTIEMNHGPRFWQLLNSLTHNKAEALRQEMKSFDTCVTFS